MPQQQEAAEEARSKDELFEDSIMAAIRTVESSELYTARGFTITDLKENLPDEYRHQSRRISAFLRALDYKSKRSSTRRYWEK